MHAETQLAISKVQQYEVFMAEMKTLDSEEMAIRLNADDECMEFFTYGFLHIFKDHAKALAKARLLTITGDTSHLSVRYKIELLENIDKEPEYSWQPADYYEQEVIHNVEHFGLPRYGLRPDDGKLTVEQAIACLKGEADITVALGYESNCYDCGEGMYVTLNGTNLHYTCKSGACKSNLKFEVEIDFPTGEVVFADWPHRFREMSAAGMIPSKSFDVNKLSGCRQSTDEHALYQVFHHSVGNTSPNLYYNPTTQSIQIGNEYIPAKNKNEDGKFVSPEGFLRCGSFCTDLWWVTMLDKQYYDEMIALLPKHSDDDDDDDDKIEVITIAPGRYRFTAHANIEDSMVHATAVRIGECSGVPPKRDNMAGRRVLTPKEKAVMQVWDHHKKHITEAAAESRVEYILDHTFNVIGSGIRNKSTFYDFASVSIDTDIPKFAEDDGKEHNYVYDYYPNFTRQYSTIYQMDMADIPTLWLEAGLDFYDRALTYFENGAAGYSYAYPSKRPTDDEDLKTYIDELRTEGMSESDWYAAVSKAYECEFNGDYVDFGTRRWEKEKARCIAFCNQAIADIDEELDKRE